MPAGLYADDIELVCEIMNKDTEGTWKEMFSFLSDGSDYQKILTLKAKIPVGTKKSLNLLKTEYDENFQQYKYVSPPSIREVMNYEIKNKWSDN